MLWNINWFNSCDALATTIPHVYSDVWGRDKGCYYSLLPSSSSSMLQTSEVTRMLSQCSVYCEQYKLASKPHVEYMFTHIQIHKLGRSTCYSENCENILILNWGLLLCWMYLNWWYLSIDHSKMCINASTD
jgi:hypothetical protein